MYTIKNIHGREILDSRGNPTVEVDLVLGDGSFGRASVPSGASTGSHEAIELRDGGDRYGGKGVQKAVKNINTELKDTLIGKEFDQESLDKLMITLDGTENKSRLGANAILGISLAFARAAAVSQNKSLYKYISATYELQNTSYRLPVPMFNVFNGGKHADTNLDIQEIMIMPVAKISFPEKLRCGAEVFNKLKDVLTEHNLDTDVGNEGGYAPDIKSTAEAFELIIEAIKKSGYVLKEDILLAIDAGANSFYNIENDHYVLNADNITLSREQLISLYKEWMNTFSLVSIEDPFCENDLESWTKFKKEIIGQENNFMVVADDLTVTNIKRLKTAIDNDCANAIIIKLNQIGTLSETIETVKMAQKAGWKIIVSHRSGETCDDFIADLAVAINADFIKAGSLSRGERLAKYNQLLRIEEELSK